MSECLIFPAVQDIAKEAHLSPSLQSTVMSCAIGGQEEHGETADQTSEGIKGARTLDSIKEPPHEPLAPPGPTHLVQGTPSTPPASPTRNPNLGLAFCVHPDGSESELQQMVGELAQASQICSPQRHHRLESQFYLWENKREDASTRSDVLQGQEKARECKNSATRRRKKRGAGISIECLRNFQTPLHGGGQGLGG